MKRALTLLLAPFVLSFARPARADAYAWGGSSGRFDVSVTIAGYNEGAGEGPLSEDAARDFAAWAVRFNAVLPPGASVSFDMGVDDAATLVTIRRPGRVEVVPMPGQPDFDRGLAILASRFGAKVPPEPRPPKLYTIQLFASRSAAAARRFVARAEQKGIEAEGSFYYSTCLPCFGHPVRELDLGDGYHRVVTGIFDRAPAARRALGKLKQRLAVDGFVREV